jgi:GT2 family glycosyltransferase
LEGKIICPDKKNSIFVRQPENSQGGVLASANFAIRRDLFEEIEGFDEDLEIMEDMELASRLRDMNYKFYFCNSAIAYHSSQPKPLSYYFHWIFHFKWQLLLSYKCKLKDPCLSSTRSALMTVYEHIIFLTRISYHLVSKFDKDRWLMYTFERLLAWITLPICLPYLIYWDQLFRLKIKANKIRLLTKDSD